MNLGPGKTTPFPIAARLPAIDRFVCVYADTPEARQHHYRLRYRVFCEETRFEDPDSFAEEAEYDRYDEHARHFLVWDRHDRQWAGAIRLVHASSTRLPSEDIVGVPLEGLDERRSRAVECSRFCILARYRRTVRSTFYGLYQAEGSPRGAAVPVLYRQEDNDVPLRLFHASLNCRPEVEHCYFIVTPALSRGLSRLGMPLIQVGPPVEHRGKRIPYRYEVEAAEQQMLKATQAFAAIAEASPPYIPYSALFARTPQERIALPTRQRGCASRACTSGTV